MSQTQHPNILRQRYFYIYEQLFEPSQQACTDQDQGNWSRRQPNSAELVSHLSSVPFWLITNPSHSVPPNVQFEIDDMEQEWTFTKKFDFIFSRMMTGAISNWVAYIERSFAYAKVHRSALSLLSSALMI